MAGLVEPIVPKAPENPLAPYLSAFALMAGVSNKRRQLEDQLQKMQLQNSQAEQKLYLQGLNYQSLDNLRHAEAAKAEAQQTAIVGKANKAIEASDDQKVWEVGMANISSMYKSGTKNYINEVNMLRPKAQRYLVTPEGKQDYAQTVNAHKEAAKETIEGHKGIADAYGNFLKDDKLNGKWLENPESWDYVDENNKSTTPAKSVKRVLKLDSNLQPLPPDSTEHAYTRTLPSTRFDQVVKLKSANDKIANDVVSGIDEPDVGGAVQAATAHKVKVAGPDGTMYMLPNDQLNDAIKQGYKQVQ